MYITINSEFRPFTYDELTKPLNDYTEAYNKVEEQYATLAQQTEAWKNIATQENSPEAYAMYKKYSDELNAVVEDFSRGMTIQNRGKLSGLKSRYASEITPIAEAYTKMTNTNNYRNEIKQKDPSAIFIVDKYNSLDDFLGGKEVNNDYISGDLLYETTARRVNDAAANKYIKALLNKKSTKDLYDPNTYSSIFNNIKEEVGYDSLDPSIQKLVDNYISSGFEAGITSVASAEYSRKSAYKPNNTLNTGTGDAADNSKSSNKWYGINSAFTLDELTEEIYPSVNEEYEITYDEEGNKTGSRKSLDSRLKESGSKSYDVIKKYHPDLLDKAVKNYAESMGVSENEVIEYLQIMPSIDYRLQTKKGKDQLFLSLPDLNATPIYTTSDGYANILSKM